MNVSTMNFFELIFVIKDTLISFSNIFINFMSMPISTLVLQIGWVKDVPILGSFLIKALGFIAPFSPMQILAGGGLTAIMILVIIKKIVPVA